MTVSNNDAQTDLPSVIMQGGATATTAHMDLLTGSTGTVYTTSVNNGHSGTIYLKFWDSKSVTVGTTDPIFVFRATASKVHTISSKTGITISNGLSVGVSDAGGTAAGSAVGANAQWVVFGS
jgi:hypothetical protein